jgi:hypothetical protein
MKLPLHCILKTIEIGLEAEDLNLAQGLLHKG